MSLVNLNELFLNENNINNGNSNNNGKNVYTQFPNLFKYEADNEDRLWLCDNNIIERKNHKTYLFILADIIQTSTLKNYQTSTLKHFKLPDFSLDKMKANLKQYYLTNNNV